MYGVSRKSVGENGGAGGISNNTNNVQNQTTISISHVPTCSSPFTANSVPVKQSKVADGPCQTSSSLTQQYTNNDQRLDQILQHLPQKTNHSLSSHRTWLISHLDKIQTMDRWQVEALAALLDRHEKWTIVHFQGIRTMNNVQLEELPALLDEYKKWTTDHLQDIKTMDRWPLRALPALLDEHEKWTTDHLQDIKAMGSEQLQALAALLDRHEKWTTIHLQNIKTMYRWQLQALPALLKKHEQWTTVHLQAIRAMEKYQLSCISGLLGIAPEWTKKHFYVLMEIPEEILKNLHSFFEIDVLNASKLNEQDFKNFASETSGDAPYFFGILDDEFKKFAGTANPFIQGKLQTAHHELSDTELKAYGASRSTLDPSKYFESVLIQKFVENYKRIPEATFGVEYEMFIPGLTSQQYSNLKNILNTENYSYTSDGSLTPTSSFDGAVELVSPILSSPQDMQKLQNTLSILNDMGASSNTTSGVHIHIGIKQWEASIFSKNTINQASNIDLSVWDAPDPDDEEVTPFQLRFMKQFFVNMHSIQKDFYLVSRNSEYSRPNEPARKDKGIEEFYKDITAATNVDGLITIAQPDGHEFNVNLESIYKHGTIEIRGFTKKNSDRMGVDPNMPLRDILFLQEVLIKTLEGTKDYVVNDSLTLKKKTLPIQPRPGLQEIMNRYTQDTFSLEIVHALWQRESGKRLATMGLIVKDRKHIQAKTLERIKTNHQALLAEDEVAQHFLNALEGKSNWSLPPTSAPILKRKQSLRSLSGILGARHAALA